MLFGQFKRYFEVQVDVNPPIKLQPCIVLQADQPYVVEPLVSVTLLITSVECQWRVISPIEHSDHWPAEASNTLTTD